MRKVENREEDSIGDGGEEWREEGGDRRVRKGVIPEYTGLGERERERERDRCSIILPWRSSRAMSLHSL